MPTDRAQAVAWQVRVEREEGFRMVHDKPKQGRTQMITWQGWRVEYRPLGSEGRWSRFLTDDDLAQYSDAELQQICTVHKESGRFD